MCWDLSALTSSAQLLMVSGVRNTSAWILSVSHTLSLPLSHIICNISFLCAVCELFRKLKTDVFCDFLMLGKPCAEDVLKVWPRCVSQQHGSQLRIIIVPEQWQWNNWTPSSWANVCHDAYLGGSLQLDFTFAFIIGELDGQNKGAAVTALLLFSLSSVSKYLWSTNTFISNNNEHQQHVWSNRMIKKKKLLKLVITVRVSFSSAFCFFPHLGFCVTGCYSPPPFPGLAVVRDKELASWSHIHIWYSAASAVPRVPAQMPVIAFHVQEPPFGQ